MFSSILRILAKLLGGSDIASELLLGFSILFILAVLGGWK